MKICILDGTTTNPGDISWAEIEAVGELSVYDFTQPDQILERAAGAEILLTNKTPLDGAVIAALRERGLRYIGTLSTGYNVVDVAAAKEQGIPVCNVPSYCTKAVAQFTFALIFAFANRVQEHSQSVRRGEWTKQKHFCYWHGEFMEMQNKTLGIFGFGNIGRTVARIALDLGMQVLVSSRTRRELPEGCRWVEPDVLFAQSDILSLHCPLTTETQNLVNARTLALMKPSALLVNTARGALVDEAALAEALNAGRLAGACVDVLSAEPPPADNPLLTAENCIITPHIAWAAKEARMRLVSVVAENIRSFLSGSVQNNVAK